MCTATTNCGSRSYSKFTQVGVSRPEGGNSLTNSGSPNGGNPHGDGAPVVVDLNEGEQLVFPKGYCLEKSGACMLKELAETEFDSVKGMYQIFSDADTLRFVYNRIKSQPSSMTSGVNGEDLNATAISERFFSDLVEEMRSGAYRPSPVKRVPIPKKGDKVRPLGIPTVRDWIVQSVLKLLLEAIYEKRFSWNSHGYRPGKSVHTVAANLRKWHGISWFIEGGIIRYFDNVDHHVLMEIVGRVIKDRRVLELMWRFLRSGVVIDGQVEHTRKGISQGRVTSPVLSNIYLNEFDQFMLGLKGRTDIDLTSIPNPEYRLAKSRLKSRCDKKGGYKQLRAMKPTNRVGVKVYYVRYADDWLIGV
jgi:group II intron reverse transcriptase/maturase